MTFSIGVDILKYKLRYKRKADLKPENFEILRRVGQLSTMGITLVASAFGGVFLGNYLDGRFHTRPWFTIGGLVAGMVLGFWNMFVTVSQIDRGRKKET